MNKPLLWSIALAVTMGVAAPTSNAHEKGKAASMPPGPSGELHKIMMGGMKHDMKISGETDRDFAAMMIMHHQQAMDMADVELKSGTSPELKAIAQRMKDQQAKEIQELQKYD